MKLCDVLVFLFAVTCKNMASSQYAPELSIELCAPSKIVVSLKGAAAGGIIYIKGAGAVCKQETSFNISTQHEFDFDSCGVDPYEMFYMIVQKNPLYQKGNDLQIPIMCLYELEITVGNAVNVGDDVDDAMINKTVRPTVTMGIYRDGVDVSGQEIDLTDTLTMSIQLGNDYIQDFDLKAKYCTADILDINVDFCAVDTELFPSFSSPTQGVLTTQFGAFRTTSMMGGSVEMIFSCTLQLCFGRCSPTVCSDNPQSYGRRKREVTDEEILFDDVSVGAMVKVGTQSELDGDNEKKEEICVHLALLVITIFTAVVLISMTTFSVVTAFLKKNPSPVPRVSYKCNGKNDVIDNKVDILQNNINAMEQEINSNSKSTSKAAVNETEGNCTNAEKMDGNRRSRDMASLTVENDPTKNTPVITQKQSSVQQILTADDNISWGKSLSEAEIERIRKNDDLKRQYQLESVIKSNGSDVTKTQQQPQFITDTGITPARDTHPHGNADKKNIDAITAGNMSYDVINEKKPRTAHKPRKKSNATVVKQKMDNSQHGRMHVCQKHMIGQANQNTLKLMTDASQNVLSPNAHARRRNSHADISPKNTKHLIKRSTPHDLKCKRQ